MTDYPFLVPQPKAGEQELFLTSEKTWEEPSEDVLFLASTGNWMKCDDTHYFLRGDASWAQMELLPPIPTTQAEFEALSWKEIAALANDCAKNGATNYKHLVGLTKSDELAGRGTVNMQLIALNHGKTADGNVAGFKFLSVELVADGTMWENYTDLVLWDTCLVREELNTTVYDSLPDDLKKYIKTTSLTCDGEILTSSTTDVVTTFMTVNDKLWIPSISELDGRDYKYGDEGEPFDYFLDGSYPLRKKRNLSGSLQEWWTRTPFYYSSKYYRFKTASGTGATTGAGANNNKSAFYPMGFTIGR